MRHPTNTSDLGQRNSPNLSATLLPPCQKARLQFRDYRRGASMKAIPAAPLQLTNPRPDTAPSSRGHLMNEQVIVTKRFFFWFEVLPGYAISQIGLYQPRKPTGITRRAKFA